MRTNEEIRNLAIKTHDYDANKFQSTYESNQHKSENVFLYGRSFIEKEILNILKHYPKGSKVLDIGSGTGHLASMMKKLGYEVYGLEPSKEMINLARTNFPEIQFKEGVSVLLPYPENYFDFIISIEVMRYLSSDDVFNTYKEILRVLRKNGRFIVTHVNKYSADGYYLYYKIKDINKNFKNHHHHYCYFTTARKEMENINNIGFLNPSARGRMFGSIRIAYKINIKLGKMYVKFLEFFNKDQIFESEPRLSWSGHLFIIGKK
jgi:ubiquinone/menaquinone biosynthesis C-methylase UbiE